MPDTAQIYSLTKEKVFDLFQTSDKGLSESQASSALGKFGPNKLTAKKRISALSMYLGQFKNTLTLILIGSAFLILFIYFFGEHDSSDLVEAGLILGIVLMISILGFVQEFKAEKAIESLKKLLAFKAKVRRGGIEKEIDVADLVPGDIVILEEGVKTPADIRLLEVFSLSVNEASLTGESVPVSKITGVLTGNLQINDQKNMIFAGTAISSGRAVGVVVKTGDGTEIGKIARDVSLVEDEETPIQKRLDEIGKVIGYVILGICVIVFIFIYFFARDFQGLTPLNKIIHSFIAAVALAVAAIPEGLPAVVTISLALGTQRMLRKNALVRKLNSVETLGSTDIICSDKTGTLTKGEMTIRKIYFDGEIIDISGIGYERVGKFTKDGKKVDSAKLSLLLKAGLLCNNASISNKDQVLGDPTEASLLVSAAKAGITQKPERLMEVPFSSERKMMSVVVKEGDKYLVFTKGAPEILLTKCEKIFKKGKEANMTKSDQEEVVKTNLDFSNLALRNLGLAYKILTKKEYDVQVQDAKKLEQGLTFLGIQAMIDPPRIEVKPLIQSCLQSGIRVIMITGDHGATAQAVAREIGIVGEVLTGEDLEKMTDEKFSEIVEKVSIYARVNPGVKMRIVNALKKKGHIVAMTGDGVNDAPALKASDIGIAMGITGTDVAKESSDMVLLDDKFSTIISSIEEGRGIFHNIRKFVDYLLSCNIGEVLVVFTGVMLFQKLPLTAIQLLWINVVTDGIPAVALGLDPAEKGIMRYSPKVFQSQIISKKLWAEMIVFGILLTIGVLGIYVIDLPRGLADAQGAAFNAIVVFELVGLYLIRSDYKTSFFSNKWLLFSIVVTLSLQLLIAYTPFLAKLFEIKGTDWLDWVYIFAVSGLLWIVFKFIQSLLNKIPALRENTLAIE
ncbi:MAG TPA: cation-translocating P-type ATPase [Candidatus Limnocylindrales bacterium]|nr:cation-translocating P-type ATPase [Candidatus Limnocylindrales bacterium]